MLLINFIAIKQHGFSSSIQYGKVHISYTVIKYLTDEIKLGSRNTLVIHNMYFQPPLVAYINNYNITVSIFPREIANGLVLLTRGKW